MSAFDDALEAAIGDAGDTADIRPTVVPLYEYQFSSGNVRLWPGQGRLFTSDGSMWLGSTDGLGQEHHKVPRLADGRDGSAASLEFGFPFIDKATFDAIKAERELIAGRLIRCFLVLVLDGEGLRPSTPKDFFGEYTMQQAAFSDQPRWTDDGAFLRSYGININAKSGNVGRSQTPGGTYTDTCQQQRAALLGVTTDYGCGFVASLANQTLTFP